MNQAVQPQLLSWLDRVLASLPLLSRSPVAAAARPSKAKPARGSHTPPLCDVLSPHLLKDIGACGWSVHQAPIARESSDLRRNWMEGAL